MVYSLPQWLLIFFTYCVLGWIWESCYVSALEHRWVNRGFLYGPWLPIYGSGAVIILIFVLPVQENLFLVFLAGMFSATVLEYFTGAAMEHIFHMRYWDYTGKRFNLNGYICLSSSLCWGCFSCLLLKFLHPPIRDAVLDLPRVPAEILSFSLAIVFMFDTVKSAQAAFEIKVLLKKLAHSQKLFDEAGDKLVTLMSQMSSYSEQLKTRMTELKETVSEREKTILQELDVKDSAIKNTLLTKLENQRNRKSKLLTALKEKADYALQEISNQLSGSSTEQEKERLQHFQSGLDYFKSLIIQLEKDLSTRKNRDFQKAVSILNRNPSAVSHRYRDAFAQLSHLINDRKRGPKK